MSKILAFISGKGGTGKTTLVANIGAALAALGKKTAVIDLDAGLRNLDIALGLQNEVVYDFSDVISGRCSLDNALIKAGELMFLAAPQSGFDGRLDSLFKHFGGYDFVLLDCPSGISKNYESYADICFIVTTPDMMSVRDADKCALKAEERGCKSLNIIINKFSADTSGKQGIPGVDYIVDIVAAPLIGVVPFEQKVVSLTSGGKLAVPDKKSAAGKACVNIARRILGDKVPVLMGKQKLFGK